MNELSKVKIEKEAKEKSLGLEWPGNRLVRGQKLGAGFNPIGALLFKNILSLKRHTVFMAFFVLMPIVSLLLFIACIGRMPQNLTISVVYPRSGLNGASSLFWTKNFSPSRIYYPPSLITLRYE